MATKFEVDLSDAQDLRPEIPYVITSAGSYKWERNDCGLTALALTTGISYKLIHNLAKVCYGRKDKTPALTMHRSCRYYPFKIRKVSNGGFKLSTLLDKFPKGNYYVQIGGWPCKNFAGDTIECHALALRDGVLYDTHINSPDRWVHGVWKIQGLKSKQWFGWRK